MKIVIAGAGRAGALLVEFLSRDNDVTVIDEKKEVLDFLSSQWDVRCRLGNVQNPSVIEETVSQGCELFIATLGDDGKNLISACCAKNFGAEKVVAKVTNPVYLDNSFLYENILGVDFLLSPDHLAGIDIAEFAESPGLMVSEEYGNDRIQFYELRIFPHFKDSGKTLREIMSGIKEKVVIGYVRSGKRVEVPFGDTPLKTGDILGLFGRRDGMVRTVRHFAGDWGKKKKVAILGGTNISVQIVRAINDKVASLKLFERDKTRAEELGEQLSKYRVDVINDDLLSNRSLWNQIRDYDVFIAPTHDDERNVVSASLAKDMGIPYVVSVIYNKQFGELVYRFGIDYSVIPYYSFANRILRIVYQNTVKHLLNLRGIEIAEFKIVPSFKYLDKPLRDIRYDIGCVVAGIIRNGQPIIPTGDDCLMKDDEVVIVTTAEKFNDVKAIFSG